MRTVTYCTENEETPPQANEMPLMHRMIDERSAAMAGGQVVHKLDVARFHREVVAQARIGQHFPEQFDGPRAFRVELVFQATCRRSVADRGPCAS